jgi:crotonobetainyl-CoA:carnitine CoA-transferase CaiB-like acyl-CoA transferase
MPDLPPPQGVRVLELSRTLAAPFAGQMLADFGADVIKVERPGQDDESRRIGPTFLRDASGNPTAEGSLYLAANRNKRSNTVDLSRPAGQEIIKRLARQSDILVENYKPGGLARYGLDYETLRGANPRLIYCSVSGFGHSGPHSPRAGYDPIFQAMAGWMSVNGADQPMLVNSNVVDRMAAYHSVIGILAALRERDEHSGHGQHIDIALLDVAIAAFAHRAQDFLLTGHQPPPRTNRGIIFPCADGEVVIAVGNEGHWVQFATFSVALTWRRIRATGIIRPGSGRLPSCTRCWSR